jgi:16S rRNA (uracil1498-N3)-methyltransferase
MHRIFWSATIPGPGERLVVTGEEAAHAGVKRLEIGEPVEVLDGQGTVARASVARLMPGKRTASLELLVESVRVVERPMPLLHIRSASPKGDRLEWMVEQLSQVGAASWGPLTTARGVADPGEGKLDRLERIAVAASKQCGMAHLLQIAPKARVDDLTGLARGGQLVVAAGGGEPWRYESDSSESPVVLAIGPEGDWTPQELDQLRAAGGRVCRFGPHIMRIETAAVAAAAIIMAHAPSPLRP